MPNMNITYGEMNDTAVKMRNNTDTIIATLNECKTMVGNLVAQGFDTDTASDEFERVHAEFNIGANKTMETLPQLSAWLDQAVTALQNMDNEMAASLRGKG